MLTTNAKIQAYRHQASMTQADVAKKIGISRQMFCYKEAGKTEWKLKELEGLAVVFGVSVRDLLGD